MRASLAHDVHVRYSTKGRLIAVDVKLVEFDGGNREAALALRVAPEQERFVGGSVADALAEAAEYPHAKPWYRLACVGDVPVGFVMISWNVEPRPPEIIGPWFLWKLLIDLRYQGRGYGARVVRQVADLVRAQGATELLTSLVPGEGGPGGFYERLGFVPAGEFDINGEAILRLALAGSVR
jgi:diamine N-acetyltransferase